MARKSLSWCFLGSLITKPVSDIQNCGFKMEEKIKKCGLKGFRGRYVPLILKWILIFSEKISFLKITYTYMLLQVPIYGTRGATRPTAQKKKQYIFLWVLYLVVFFENRIFLEKFSFLYTFGNSVCIGGTTWIVTHINCLERRYVLGPSIKKIGLAVLFLETHSFVHYNNTKIPNYFLCSLFKETVNT